MQQANTSKNFTPAVENSNKMGSAEWLLLLILSFLWGGSFFFSKIAVTQLPPFTVVLGRVSLAALTLNLTLPARLPDAQHLAGLGIFLCDGRSQ